MKWTLTVPGMQAGAIWQSEFGKTYQCPDCGGAVRTLYEGNAKARVIQCNGALNEHVIEFDDRRD